MEDKGGWIIFFKPQSLITQDLGIAVIYDPEEINQSVKMKTYVFLYDLIYVFLYTNSITVFFFFYLCNAATMENTAMIVQ